MAMEQSILKSTKQILGLDPENTPHFDLDILTHINASFAVAKQVGIGTISIQDDTATWSSLALPEDQRDMLKTYVFLKVKLLWDPPSTSFHIKAAEDQLKEFESRLNYAREYALSLEEG